MNERWPEWLFEYDHNGHTYCITIIAPSAEDARARMKRLPFARLMGETVARISMPNWFARLFGVGASQ